MFNEQTERLLAMPDFFVEDLGLKDGNRFFASNLYFTYFGLTALGVAAFLFSIFCPREIGDQPDRTQFVMNIGSIEAKTLSKANFQEALRLKFMNERHGKIISADYPWELEGDFHALMEAMYSQYPVSSDSYDEGGPPEVMMSNGYLDFSDFAYMLYNNNRASWAYTIPFFELCSSFSKDIAFVLFQSLDFTRYRVRLSIACLYLVGFILVMIPTAKVFFRLSVGVFSGW